MPFDEWDEVIREKWWEIQAGRPPDGLPDDADFVLYPYLHCSCAYYREHWLFRRRFAEIDTRPPESPWDPELTVWNSGSFPSWTCHVEILENPGAVLKARTIISLQPDETAVVKLEVTTGEEGTSLVGVCYDPVFDPLELRDPSRRKLTPMAVIMTVAAPRIRVTPELPSVVDRLDPY
jgi:hypothetical protein